MRVQRSVPTKGSELLEMSVTYHDGVKDSRLFDNPAAKALADALGETAGRFKTACDAARFHDTLKVAERNQIQKELVAALKRVIHYIEAMATDDDLKELQKAGVRLAKPKTRKKRAKTDEAEVVLAPAGA